MYRWSEGKDDGVRLLLVALVNHILTMPVLS